MENFLVDVGACTGEFTDSWLRLNPGGFVLCIEPHPDNFKALEKKYEDYENVKVMQAAVSFDNSAPTAKFYYGTTNQNGSLCVGNEAQVAIQTGIDAGTWPEMHYEVVDTHNINSVLTDIQDEDTLLTLKVDVEGLEFRILNAIDDNNKPDIIYFEDSCTKTRSKEEWTARLEYFRKIKEEGSTANINVEKRPLVHDEYILNYGNISEYSKFVNFENISALSYSLLKSAQDLARACIDDAEQKNPGLKIAKVEFPFYMTNCHYVIMHTEAGEVGEIHNEDPLFHAEWVDWITSAVTQVVVKADMSVSVKVEPMILGEAD